MIGFIRFTTSILVGRVCVMVRFRQLACDHGMCAECVATFPRSRGRPPFVPVHVAGELWPNALNRAVGVLGSSGMGWGAMVLPFLSRHSEGAAVHATSVECFNTTNVQYDQWPVDEVR
jgi:hypothetical protein